MLSDAAELADHDPRFVGILELGPNPADKTGNTLIVMSANFAFYDDDGLVWEAKKGATTDGASIPRPLKWIIGRSFDTPYLPAAVLHDIYCQSKEHTWQQTAEMFFEAMVTNGVSRHKAAIMWAAVYAFGPHW